MRQCQYKIKCMFLNFAIQGFFMETIMTFYVITLSCRVSGVFTHAYYIQIFRFFLLDFLNIIFIEY
jgi:hypothetical protein